MKRSSTISRALLAGSMTLALLAGCQSTAPTTSVATPKGAGQTTSVPTSPSTGAASAKATVTAAEDLAGLLSAEREAEDLDGLAAEEEKAAYAILALDDEGKARKAPPDGVVITGLAGDHDDESDEDHAAHAPGGVKPGAKVPRVGAERDLNATAAMARDGGMRPEGARPKLTKEQRDQLRQAAEKRAESKKAEHEKKAGEARVKAFKDKLKDDLKAKLDAREKDRQERAKGRLAQAKAKLDKAREALKKVDWVKNDDGTMTKTVAFDASRTVNGATETHTRKMVRTVRQDTKQLVSMVTEFVNAKANGASTTINRSKTLNADGTYTVLFHSAIVLPDGTTRTSDWTKTIAVDGKVSGSGKIVWEKDGATVKTVDVNFDGTVEREKAKVEDGKESAEVVVPVDGAPTATVTDDAGKTAPVEVKSDAEGNVEVSDEGEAEAAAEAPATGA